jgi:hypothetical protein
MAHFTLYFELNLEKRERKAPIRGVKTLRYLEHSYRWIPLQNYEYDSVFQKLQSNRHSSDYRIAHQSLYNLLLKLNSECQETSGKIIVRNQMGKILELKSDVSVTSLIKGKVYLDGKTVGFPSQLTQWMIENKTRNVELDIVYESE